MVKLSHSKWLTKSRDFFVKIWWRHQIETVSALLALCAGNSPVTGEFPSQRPVTRSFDVFFDQCLNKRLSKQSWGWWFETPLYPLWCNCNDNTLLPMNFEQNWLVIKRFDDSSLLARGKLLHKEWNDRLNETPRSSCYTWLMNKKSLYNWGGDYQSPILLISPLRENLIQRKVRYFRSR